MSRVAVVGVPVLVALTPVQARYAYDAVMAARDASSDVAYRMALEGAATSIWASVEGMQDPPPGTEPAVFAA